MVYDCFTFFNELDLLEIRLNELNDVVDKFVLVESTRTFQNNTKELFFEKNKQRFNQFSSKIIHVIIDKFPSEKNSNAWDFEFNQRNGILKGLQNCNENDVIIISDIDEIPNPDKIKEFRDKPGLKVFKQKMFYYYCNCVNATAMKGDEYSWYGSVMFFGKDLTTPQSFRELAIKVNRGSKRNILTKFKSYVYWFLKSLKNPLLKRNDISVIENGGWHFSYLGGVEKIINKIESFAHSEYNNSDFKSPQKILEAINNGEDIFGRGFKYKYVKVDETFPRYLIDNKEKYRHLLRNEG